MSTYKINVPLGYEGKIPSRVEADNIDDLSRKLKQIESQNGSSIVLSKKFESFEINVLTMMVD